MLHLNFFVKSIFVVVMLSLGSLSSPAKNIYSVAYHHSDGEINLKQVNQLTFQSLPDHHQLQATHNRGFYLFKISLTDTTSPEGWILLIENEHLDTVTLYKNVGGTLVQLGVTGNNFPNKNNRYGFPQFRLTGNTREYYIKTTFKKDVTFPIRVDSLSSLDEKVISIFFQLGLYYGVGLMFFVFNFGLFIYLRDKSFIYYCAFQCFIVMSIAYADGLLTFVNTNSWFLNHADIPLHIGMAISGSLFAHTFLQMGGMRRKRWLTAGLLTCLLSAYLLSILIDSYTAFLIAEALTFILLSFFWLIGLTQYKGHAYSRFFVWGYGAFLVFGIDYFLLRKFGIFFLDLYPAELKTGSIIEMLVLSVAIISRIKGLREENELYRLKIDKYIRQAAQQQTKVVEDNRKLLENVQLRYNLTARELEVLQGITEGLTNNQIADKIFLSVHTVKFHTRNIFDKMEIRNRTQAIGRLHEH